MRTRKYRGSQFLQYKMRRERVSIDLRPPLQGATNQARIVHSGRRPRSRLLSALRSRHGGTQGDDGRRGGERLWPTPDAAGGDPTAHHAAGIGVHELRDRRPEQWRGRRGGRRHGAAAASDTIDARAHAAALHAGVPGGPPPGARATPVRGPEARVAELAALVLELLRQGPGVAELGRCLTVVVL